jgi:hypothetical protein
VLGSDAASRGADETRGLPSKQQQHNLAHLAHLLLRACSAVPAVPAAGCDLEMIALANHLSPGGTFSMPTCIRIVSLLLRKSEFFRAFCGLLLGVAYRLPSRCPVTQAKNALGGQASTSHCLSGYCATSLPACYESLAGRGITS